MESEELGPVPAGRDFSKHSSIAVRRSFDRRIGLPVSELPDGEPVAPGQASWGGRHIATTGGAPSVKGISVTSAKPRRA